MLSDSESDDDLQLTINEHYAKAYAFRKEREELSKLKEKYGSDAEEEDAEEDDEDSEEAESEDEDGEELTPAVDAAILRTLAKIKKKDPDIYDKDKSIFQQEQKRLGGATLRPKRKHKDAVKPLTIKQHALASMLETGSRTPSPEPEIVTHEHEQSALRAETISAFHHAVENGRNDENEDDLLVLREKTKDQIDREEEEYQEFLAREVGEDIEGLIAVENDMPGTALNVVGTDQNDSVSTGKRESKGKAKQESDQEFLMNYILNRGWIDWSANRVPTYRQVTQRTIGDSPSEKLPQADELPLEEYEEFDEIAEQFESSYNFRFEEPDAALIAVHPRNLESTVRRQDTTRKEARERRKQRKEEEKIKKREEIKRLKALKMKELRQKLEEIGREGGIEIDPDTLATFDLDGEWDPDKHDKQMAGLYDDEEEQPDMEKPHWEDDINVDDIMFVQDPPESKKSKKKKKKREEDDTIQDGVDMDEMDADKPLATNNADEDWDGTEEMRKRKIQEYMDEVYGMDFNDMIGDMPTRFSYTPVSAQSYSLTPAEILLATDGELNEYMGLKKIAPYRKDGRWDTKRVDRLKELKAKLKVRGWHGGNSEDHDEKQPKKRKGKKERQRAKGEDVSACDRPVVRVKVRSRRDIEVG
ncbi:KRI1-like family C-terminal-domain-containing protein [Hysterangium stoloniferum]|nr:KRI1-like family C-terminal-domain-containing protein [Hysterangium stoloniferum]